MCLGKGTLTAPGHHELGEEQTNKELGHGGCSAGQPRPDR
jgi:hypothetical protein